MMGRCISLTAVVVVLAACAEIRPFVASPSDYAAYRKVRLSRGMGERLATAWTYLRDHPDGAFRSDVAAWFEPAELRFYTEAGRTPGGAAAYLSLMPDGPHAEQEATFLRAFELEKTEAPLRAQRALEAARRKAEEARQALGVLLESWTKRGVEVKAWGAPLAAFLASEPAFRAAWEAVPAPTCWADRCVKRAKLTYPVPEANPPLDREVAAEVRLELEGGNVRALTLAAPGHGFVWWLEGAEARQVDPNDTAAREEALIRAKNRVEHVARASGAMGGSCTTHEEPLQRRIDCDRVSVTIAAGAPGNDGADVIRIAGIVPIASLRPPAPD